ncbi:hypothetical protein CB1_001091014 [Camelus ferus]|nr:hypothetical protein CB1_001091014 [Camelus ferus]
MEKSVRLRNSSACPPPTASAIWSDLPAQPRVSPAASSAAAPCSVRRSVLCGNVSLGQPWKYVPESPKESLTSTPTRASLYPGGGGKAHAFQEHIFKKPTFCDVCNHMIVGEPPPNPLPGPHIHGKPGTTAKHGLRCKACKMSIHHKCVDGLEPQRCMGKLPKGFRRYYSSPLLIHEQFGCIKEVMPIACGNKVDPVYETLRFGTSLAQRTKKGSSGSGSDSPHRTSVIVFFLPRFTCCGPGLGRLDQALGLLLLDSVYSAPPFPPALGSRAANAEKDLVEVPEEADRPGGGYDLRKRSNSDRKLKTCIEHPIAALPAAVL